MNKRVKALAVGTALIIVLVLALVGVKHLTGNTVGDMKNETFFLRQEKDVNAVNSISVKNESGEYIVLQRSEGTFLIEEIEDLHINSSSFETVLNAAIAFEYTEKIEDFTDLQQYGFDSPWAEIDIEYSDGGTFAAAFGAEAPNREGARYVYDGEGLYIVPADVCAAFGYSVNDYVSLSVMEVHNDEIEKITLGGSQRSREIVIEKTKDKTFSMSAGNDYMVYEPCIVPVSVYEGEEIVELPKHGLEAESILEIHPQVEMIEKFRLDVPDYTIEYVLQDETILLSFSWLSEENDELAVMSSASDVIYKINHASAEWMDAGLEDIAYEYVYDVDFENVSDVTCTLGDSVYSFKITRDGDSIREILLNESSLSDVKNAEEFIKKLCTALRYDTEDNAVKYETAELTVDISFMPEAGFSKDTIQYFSCGERRYGASVNGQTPYFTVAASYINEIVSYLHEF